jgi:hypothetical protein
MGSQPVCTNRKSASAESGLRAWGATRAMGIPVMRRSKHARQGVFSHQGLRKASAADPANTGLAGSAGMAAVSAWCRRLSQPAACGVACRGERTANTRSRHPMARSGAPQGLSHAEPSGARPACPRSLLRPSRTHSPASPGLTPEGIQVSRASAVAPGDQEPSWCLAR